MSSSLTPTAPHRIRSGIEPVWRHGVAAAVCAATATSAMAAVAKRLGVTFSDATGATIPVLGFANLTLAFSLIGVGLAAVLARKARRPRSTFVRTTVTLTALSVVPDFAFGWFDAASAVTLAATHVVAAAIVIPVLARRLATSSC